MTSNRYHIVPECVLRQLGDKYLLLVYPSDEDDSYALQINESFAFLLEKILNQPSFTEEEVSSLLTSQYDLSEEEARAESEKTLALWLNNGLIQLL